MAALKMATGLFKHRSANDDILTRTMNWPATSRNRLLRAVNPNGAWGYGPAASACAEPTSLACLALTQTHTDPKGTNRALEWLVSVQQPSGAVPVAETLDAPCWPTPLAMLAWLHAPSESAQRYEPNITRAADWLLETGGERLEPMPSVYGHDTTLQGWSWASGTHSWAEPTAYAVMALRAAHRGDDPRVQEGISLLLDRAIPSGGWNYGNPRVLKNTLRPFPATTGIVLAALAGAANDSRIDAAVDYLQRTLPTTRSPLSVAWGLIGLDAVDAHPADVDEWLRASVRANRRSGFDVLVDSLTLLADARWSPVSPTMAKKTT